MGCLQATETIKLLLGRRDEGILSGRVLVFDALQMKFSEVGLEKTKDRVPITDLIDYQGFCGAPQTTTTPPQQQQQQKSQSGDGNATTQAEGRTMDEDLDTPSQQTSGDAPSFHSIAPQECLDKLVQGWSPFVLDVRLQTENDIVALPFTDRLVPHRSVTRKDVPKTGDILVYCKAGVRGKKACNQLIEHGIESSRLYNLEGGILGWQKEVDTSMPRY